MFEVLCLRVDEGVCWLVLYFFGLGVLITYDTLGVAEWLVEQEEIY